MSGPQSRDETGPSGARVRRAERQCDRFEAAWKAGRRPPLEDYLAAVPGAERPALLRELLPLEVDYRRLAGEQPTADEFLDRFPALDRAWIDGVLSGAATRLDPGGAGRGAEPGRWLGKFLLLEQLGQGGCGTVWRAHDSELDRVVAVKIPHPDLLTSPAPRARFFREARAAARLSHPNVVTLFEVVQVGDTPLLVMEYVAGTDLARLVEQSGPLPVRQACDCIRQAALGLQHAHERGLVHRDVKPANLLLTAAGAVVKVLDLGLARLPRRPGDTATALTEPGWAMGTPDFIAPEQARDSQAADARADVYSLGCTLYYLLTGQVPFPGGTALEKALRHLTEEPTPPEKLRPAVWPALAALVRGMMARRPEDRPQTAAAVAAALTAAPGPGEVAPPPDRVTITRLVPVTRRRRRRAAFLLLGVAALGLLLSLRPWVWFGPPGQPATPPTVPATAREPEPFVTNSLGMKLALMPPGGPVSNPAGRISFLMGSPPTEPARFDNEGPRRKVVLTRAFYIGVYEVTQGEFEAVMGYNPSHFTRERGGGLDHPVEMVSYLVAVAFCERLSALPAEQRAGRGYRLPTEAQWEYACRAGTDWTFSFGDDFKELRRYAWFAENAAGTTHPGGQLLPNAWGLFDMHGNVWEWCADSFAANYYRDGPEEDPHCTEPTPMRVMRGGGALGGFGNRQWCRSAARGRNELHAALNTVGLRVVMIPRDAP